MQAQEGQIALARANLAVLAADPHGGAVAKAATAPTEQIAPLAEGKPWTGTISAPDENAAAEE